MSRREPLEGVVMIVHREHLLFQIIRALHASRRFSSSLDGGQKQPNQNTDDRYNDQKFDQSKTSPVHSKTL